MTLFQYIISKFTELAVDSPQAEAKLVLEHLYGNDMLLQLEDADLRKFQSVYDRRKKREPIQYILGKAFFFNSEFTVTPAVLIPRPETEIMVEKLIEVIPPGGVMADVGCGSGCIGISVALERPDVQVFAFDISPDALQIAHLNAKNLNVPNINFIQSDLFSNCPADLNFDAVGANLPYVPFVDYYTAQSEVREYEPQLALTADDDGLEIIFRCIKQLPQFMKNNGQAFFEIDPSQDVRLSDFMSQNNWHNVKIIKDYTSRSRFVEAKWQI